MRVSLNGYFLNNPHTGSGQYTLQLTEHVSDLAVAKPKSLLSNPAKLRWEQLQWPAVARKAGATLLHSPYFALPLTRSLPAVVTIHDLIPMLLPAYRGSPLVRAYTWLQARACRSAEAILVDSECSKRDVLRLLRVPEDRVHVVYLGVDPKKAVEAVGAVVAELRILGEHEVLPDELERAKEFTKGRLRLEMETTNGVAFWLTYQELLLGQISTIDEELAFVDEVTANDIKRVAGEIFRNPLQMSVIGPFGRDADFRSAVGA